MKITLKEGQKVFFTSDSHYSHRNICKGETAWDGTRDQRDFPDLTSMNNDIVNNINRCVGEDDIMFHLGDWSFGGKDQVYEFRRRIKCKNIHLIVGNHDEYIVENA
jgi:calcineurin-like phosphoesterase family protein